MTSETRIAYGSRVSRQGSSRPRSAYQSSSASLTRPDPRLRPGRVLRPRLLAADPGHLGRGRLARRPRARGARREPLRRLPGHSRRAVGEGRRDPAGRARALPLLRGAGAALRRARLPGARVRLLRPHGRRREARRGLRVPAARRGGHRRSRSRPTSPRPSSTCARSAWSRSSRSASAWAAASRGSPPPAGHGLAGAVGFYGRPGERADGSPGPAQLASKIEAPILALQAGADQNITAEDNEAFERALSDAGVEHELVVYEGAPHSFFDRKQDEFAGASEDAWDRDARVRRAPRPVIREARPDEAPALAAIQRDASLAALRAHLPAGALPVPDRRRRPALGGLARRRRGDRARRRGGRRRRGRRRLPQRMARRPLRAAAVVEPRRRAGAARRGARRACARTAASAATSGCSSTTTARGASTSGSAGPRTATRGSSRSRRSRSTSATRSRSRRRTGSAGRSRARPPRPSRTGSATCAGRAASR